MLFQFQQGTHRLKNNPCLFSFFPANNYQKLSNTWIEQIATHLSLDTEFMNYYKPWKESTWKINPSNTFSIFFSFFLLCCLKLRIKFDLFYKWNFNSWNEDQLSLNTCLTFLKFSCKINDSPEKVHLIEHILMCWLKRGVVIKFH